LLKAVLTELLLPLEQPLIVGAERPFVVMIAGVNGTGKTTSIGKLAKYLQGRGYSVLLAAGDTFRAAAREQLEIWGARNGVPVIAQQGGDPGAVMFDATPRAPAASTWFWPTPRAAFHPAALDGGAEENPAGAAAHPGPRMTLLVLDANTGQNALAQVAAFDAALISGLNLTKLDGTAKGAWSPPSPRPGRFRLLIGIGEGVDDLRPFGAAEFVDALSADQNPDSGLIRRAYP
jgi:fused signal recognition particle receptor